MTLPNEPTPEMLTEHPPVKVTAPPVDPNVAVLKAHGNVDPVTTIAVAKMVGLPLHFACALLEKESSGGKNVWGHDPTIFIGGHDARHNVSYGPVVTQKAYAAYLAQRGHNGGGGMQGVGPCQLTWYGFQDDADKLGGCWKAACNMHVGFAHLRDLIARYGIGSGAAAYNGTGPQADAYGKDFATRAEAWQSRLK